MGKDSGTEARTEALRSSRRVYDRQVTELESIDDKAMRTARTAFLIIGFVAAGLTAAGPSIAADIRTIPLIAGSLGAAIVLLSAFVGIGTYTVTRYPLELDGPDLEQLDEVSSKKWKQTLLKNLHEANMSLGQEIALNSSYLQVAQIGLLIGVFLLSLATCVSVISESYSIAPWKTVATTAILTGMIIVTAKALTEGGE